VAVAKGAAVEDRVVPVLVPEPALSSKRLTLMATA